MRAKQGKEDALRTTLEKLVGDCSHHDGLLVYRVHQEKNDPTCFLFYEHFASEAAFNAHSESPELATIRDILPDLLDGPASLNTWTIRNTMEKDA
jgi:quinol monooxygenase YgiN